MQKELKNIKISIEKWIKANKGNVCFVGDFVSFDKKKIKKNEEDITKDAIKFAYGDKKTLSIMLKSDIEDIKKEKEEFINW